MFLRSLLFLLTMQVSAFADEPRIRFPEVQPAPQPAPQPPPQPNAVQKLTASQWYVIDSNVPLLVLSSPGGKVSVTEEEGPIKIRGVFVGGTKVETRTFTEKHVYTIEAVSSGLVELIVIPVGADKISSIIRRQLEVVTDSKVEPDKEEKKEDKKPEPKPNKVEKLRMVVLRNPADMSPANLILADVMFWKSFGDKGHKVRFYAPNDSDGKPYYADAPDGSTLPLLLIYDEADTSKPIKIVPFPATKDTISKTVSEVSK